MPATEAVGRAADEMGKYSAGWDVFDLFTEAIRWWEGYLDRIDERIRLDNNPPR
jgi:hypothetical protein